MTISPILQPIITLVLWTFVMWFLMYMTRIPAITKMRLKMDNQVPPKDLMNQLPPRVRWKADNYNHLYEMPTIFYATALCLALANAGDGTNLVLAWVYVGLRVLHSLFQSFINIIELRFLIFVLSSLVLFTLAIKAVGVVFCGTAELG